MVPLLIQTTAITHFPHDPNHNPLKDIWVDAPWKYCSNVFSQGSNPYPVWRLLKNFQLIIPKDIVYIFSCCYVVVVCSVSMFMLGVLQCCVQYKWCIMHTFFLNKVFPKFVFFQAINCEEDPYKIAVEKCILCKYQVPISYKVNSVYIHMM